MRAAAARPQVAASLRMLHPGSFAFVMATGILSSGASDFGAVVVSRLLLVVAAVGFAVLCVLLAARFAWFQRELWADTARPERAFGFFTFVAGSNVLAVRLAEAGARAPAEVLAIAGAAAWLLLGYGILARVVLASEKPGPDAAVNGTWLMWVVGTQSVSVAASTLGTALGLEPRVTALAAVSLWAFGALLYLLLMSVILARLVLARLDAAQASPPYWISMGATAITVLAGADLLTLPASLPALAASRATVEGLTLCLWAFGTWWFPFLVLLTVWRYRQAAAPAYEQTLWSMVFPLAMYAVATDAYGRAAGLPLLLAIARTEFWLALAVWLAVASWMAISWFAPGWPGGRSRWEGVDVGEA
jgi:tellurite resistance protein TehA-like permease